VHIGFENLKVRRNEIVWSLPTYKPTVLHRTYILSGCTLELSAYTYRSRILTLVHDKD